VANNIREYLEKYLNDSIRDKVLKMYEDYAEDIAFYPASIKYHHNSQGGLYQHILEVIEYSFRIYNSFESEFKKKLVTKSDVVFLAFIHDLEKTNKYVKNDDYNSENFKPNVYEFKYNYNKIDMNDTAQVVRICAKYGIILSDKQLNALTFTHGGWRVDKGKMLSLATLIHMADMFSITFNEN
jgi:hypothetical protein